MAGCVFVGSLGILPTPHVHAQASEAAEEPGDDSEQVESSGEPGAQPENADAAQRARTHFRAGIGHFERRAFREAIQEFQLAAGLVPSADLWFNIARGYEELDDHEAAIEHYRRYLRDRVDPPDKEQVEQRIASLEEQAEAARLARLQAPTTGTMRLSSNLDDAAIEIDGRSSGRTPVAAPLSLSPGRHELELDEEGYVPFRSAVRIEAGVNTTAYADLVPMTRYRSIRGRRIFTWIVGGLAVLGIGASVALGVHARNIANDAQAQLDAGMAEQADATFRNAQDWGAISDYALGGSLVLALGAVILYFVEGRAVGTERIEPEVQPRRDEHAALPGPSAF